MSSKFTFLAFLNAEWGQLKSYIVGKKLPFHKNSKYKIKNLVSKLMHIFKILKTEIFEI